MKKYLKIFKKIFFISAGLFLFLMLTVVMLHEIFITPEFVRNQVIKIFMSSFNKEIILKRIDVSLVKGVEIDNLILYNPKYCRKKIFFKIDKLRFKYDLFSMLFLRFKINEISVINPYISMEYNQHLNKWNFSDFIKESDKKKKEKKDKKKGPLKIDLNLKKFVIQNFTMEFLKGFYFKLTGINYMAHFKMNEVSAKGIESAYFNFFSTGKDNITLKTKDTTLIMPFNLKAKLDAGNKKDGSFLVTYDLLDQNIELKNKFYTLPDIRVRFDSRLTLQKSKFLIKQFLIEVDDNPLVNITAEIDKFDSAPDLILTMQNNFLNLKDFENTIKLISELSSLKIDGTFKTSKFVVKQDPQKKFPLLIGDFSLKDVDLLIPEKNILIKDLDFSADFNMNKYKILIGHMYLNIDSIMANIIDVRNFNISTIVKYNLNNNNIDLFNMKIKDCKINEGLLESDISLKNSDLKGEIRLTGLQIRQFNKMVQGDVNIIDQFTIHNMETLQNDLSMNITNFKFASGKSNQIDYSKNIPVEISSRQIIHMKNKKLKIEHVKAEVSDFITFYMTGRFQDQIFTGNIHEFKIITDNVIDKLPESMVFSLPFQSFQGTINTFGKIRFQDAKLTANIVTTNDSLLLNQKDSGLKLNNLNSRIKFVSFNKVNNIKYDFSLDELENKKVSFNTNTQGHDVSYEEIVNGLHLNSKIIMDAQKINIKKFNFTIPDIDFALDMKGKVKTKPEQNIDLKAKLEFEPKKQISFLKNGQIKGGVNLVSDIETLEKNNDIHIKGEVLFQQLSVVMNDLEVKEIDGYLPFSHIITKNKIDRKVLKTKSAKKDLQLLNYPLTRSYTEKPDNFKIKRIKTKDVEINNFALDIDYNDNLLSLRKGYIELLNGSITINNSFFDLGNLEPDTFRYKFNIEISQLDIRKLDFIKAEEDDDTKITANIRLNGSGINLQKSGDIYGAFNVTHIGNKVAARFLTAMDPNGKDGNVALVKDLLYKGAWPELFILELKYGQVLSRMWVDKKFYMLWVPMPPSPIEFKEKSLDVIMKSFKKSEKG